MSSPTEDAPDGDWRAVLATLQQLHARLSTQADALRVGLARPAAGWDGEVLGLGWGLGDLPEAERVALRESVCADLLQLGALADKLTELLAWLETSDLTRPPDKSLLLPAVPRS
jgi:hypothetical protein